MSEKRRKRKRRVAEPKFPGPTQGWGQETAGGEKTEGREKGVLFANSTQVEQLECSLPREADGKWDLKHFTQVSGHLVIL